MQLHQINLSYDPMQDRLLMRISTSERSEFRLWFTRRITQRLWPNLFKLLELQDSVRTQSSAEAKRAVLEFRREHALQEVSFGGGFDGEALKPALEGEPLLVHAVDMSRSGPETFMFRFSPPPGCGNALQVQLQEKIVHGMTRLIEGALKKSDWGLQLALPTAAPASTEPESAGRRSRPRKPN